MAKSKNAVNDAALESAAGGAYGTTKGEKSTEFDLYKDDGTYLGTFGRNEEGFKLAKETLGYYGNKEGTFNVFKEDDKKKGSASDFKDPFDTIKWK